MKNLVQILVYAELGKEKLSLVESVPGHGLGDGVVEEGCFFVLRGDQVLELGDLRPDLTSKGAPLINELKVL